MTGDLRPAADPARPASLVLIGDDPVGSNKDGGSLMRNSRRGISKLRFELVSHFRECAARECLVDAGRNAPAIEKLAACRAGGCGSGGAHMSHSL